MANSSSLCFFFLLSLFILCCSGTLVGFSYRERGNADDASEPAGIISFLKHNKVPQSHIRIFVTDRRILSIFTNSQQSLDFYLNESLVRNFIRSKPNAVSWIKHHLVDLLPQVEIKSIIASCGSIGQNEIPLLLSALESIHSVLRKLHIGREVKVSVAFPLSLLEKLKRLHGNDLNRILSFIKETNSFVMIEDSIHGELSMGDHFVQSIIKRATLVASILPYKDVPMVLTIKSPAIPSSMEVAQFSERVSKYLEATSTEGTGRIIALYAEVHAIETFEQEELKREEEEIFPLYRREILSKFHIRRTLDDITNPPNTVYPTNPTSPTQVITTPDTPTIITVPSTNPVTVSPTNPAATPVTVPSTTPVPLSPTNPANSGTAPITVPGAQPATYYPPPSGSVPVVNPIPPPANTNAPATTGQSWCVAKTGASETALQSALDYACGMGGADCSQIQQGGNCYNPNSLQNHASYAFNSYYQKNPAPTSCDFGGAASLVNVNPSTGSCIYPSSSSSSSSSTPVPLSPITTPSTPMPSSPTPTSSSSGTGTSGYGTPPSVLNSSNPAAGMGTTPVFGSESPGENTASSHSTILQPFLGFMVVVISMVSGKLSMRS
ncbi:Glucan endo-1,3-beta-glucosidase 1 [Senna tora]|uniref:Glucan endo-1,3-beta-glucosidase 1 n=1 Tax=Senna tora TaxID=362788 RepID=A0A834WG21_9FABA|nr:Glucan endo-1,3-beta-glucosidase 1 [Senna tora]